MQRVGEEKTNNRGNFPVIFEKDNMDLLRITFISMLIVVIIGSIYFFNISKVSKVLSKRDFIISLIGHAVIVDSVFQNTENTEIQPELLLAIIKNETDFKNITSRPNANRSFDIGICALNSYTYRDYNYEDLLNISANINLAVKHLQRDLQKYKGNKTLAILAYNSGYYKIDHSQIGEQRLIYVDKIYAYKYWLENSYVKYLQQGAK
jgi:hypothetical protein